MANNKKVTNELRDQMPTFCDQMPTFCDQMPTFRDQMPTFCDEIMISNAMVFAKWEIGLNELRLLLLAISRIVPGNLSCEITAKEFSKTWDVPPHDVYKEFRRISKGLTSRIISFENNDAWIDYSLVQRIGGTKKYSGKMLIRLNESFAVLFTRLSENFFKVPLKQLRKLDTVTGMRFYMFVRAIFDREYVSLDLAMFQRILGTSYKRKTDLLRRVVKPEIGKLEKTDIKLVLLKSSPKLVRFRILRNDHEARLIREFRFKPKDAKSLVAEIRKRPDCDDYLDECLQYCRENLKSGVIRLNVVSYVRKFILEDFRPVNPRAVRGRQDEKERRERIDEERKMVEKVRREEEEMKKLAERFRCECSSEYFRKLLDDILADPGKDDFFKDLLRQEMKQGVTDIDGMPEFIQCEILERWKDDGKPKTITA